MFTEERMIVREGARYWWVFLLTGIAWLVLRLNETSLTTVGVLLGVSQVVQAADEPQERLLDEILGERSVARQEVGEPEPGRGRPDVDLLKPAFTPLLGSHIGDHRRLFRTHITRTYEDPKVLRSWAVGVLRISPERLT